MHRTKEQRVWWRWACLLARLYSLRAYSPLYRLIGWVERKERAALHKTDDSDLVRAAIWNDDNWGNP